MIAVIRRRLGLVANAQSQDRGLSLTELLVAMMVFSILLAMTVGFFVSAAKANQTNRNLTVTNGSASTAMNEVTRMIRGAVTHPVSGQLVDDPAFSVATANSLTFYTSVNRAGTTANMLQVTYSLTGTTLFETIVQPTATGTGTNLFYSFPTTNPTVTKAIAYNVVLPAAGGPSLFGYVNSSNTDFTSSVVATPATSIPLIAAVTVSIQVGTTNNTSQSTFLTDTVGLPNLNIARDPS